MSPVQCAAYDPLPRKVDLIWRVQGTPDQAPLCTCQIVHLIKAEK